MKKFLPFSKRQPSLDRFNISRGGFNASDRFNGKSLRRTSATSLNTKSIQVVRGAYNIDLNKVDARFTKLHKACLLNDEAQVKKHLHRIDNNSHDSSNRYPLHLACVNGNFAIVKLLIENKADPNVQDNDGNTPIIKSIECGHEHLVKYLLENGADPNLTDLDRNTALHWALTMEAMIAIEALIGSGKCDLSHKNGKDETCLHVAVRCPHVHTSTYQKLIGAGSNSESRDQLGLTPKDIAQACDNKEALKAFEICHNDTSENDTSDPAIDVRKLCEDYKTKYLAKNKENLEYEKKIIQMNAQLERLKLDMSYLKEQNTKLEIDNAKLGSEVYELKNDNCNLEDLVKKLREFEPDVNESTKDHEKFVTAKTFLRDQINRLRYELTTKEE